MSSEALERARLVRQARAVPESRANALVNALADQVEALLAEVARLEQERRDLKRWNTRVVEQLAVAREREQRRTKAIQQALAELGVPGHGYPAPVANAVEILRAALVDEPAAAMLAEPGSVRPVEQARPGSASAAADEPGGTND